MIPRLVPEILPCDGFCDGRADGAGLGYSSKLIMCTGITMGCGFYYICKPCEAHIYTGLIGYYHTNSKCTLPSSKLGGFQGHLGTWDETTL